MAATTFFSLCEVELSIARKDYDFLGWWSGRPLIHLKIRPANAPRKLFELSGVLLSDDQAKQIGGKAVDLVTLADSVQKGIAHETYLTERICELEAEIVRLRTLQSEVAPTVVVVNG